MILAVRRVPAYSGDRVQCRLQYADDLPVVMVTLCDYMTRKFQRRVRAKLLRPVTSSVPLAATDVSGDDDDEYEYLVGIEDALHSCSTKLKSSHARSRIQAQVLSFDALLPSSVRQNEKLSSNMIVSGWVNFRKTRCALSSSSSFLFSYITENTFTGSTYRT